MTGTMFVFAAVKAVARLVLFVDARWKASETLIKPAKHQ